MLRHVCGGLLLAAFALPVCAEEKKTEKKDEGFTQLFNGKDLTGWKTHPDDKAKWEVKDGAIVGAGPAGHLFTERGDYENFHSASRPRSATRATAANTSAPSSPRASRPATRPRSTPPTATRSAPAASTRTTATSTVRRRRRRRASSSSCIKPDEWFTQEVIADGNHIIIKVNGKVTVDFIDEKNRHTKGHFAIQQHNDGSVVKVRKVEVKELPATEKK